MAPQSYLANQFKNFLTGPCPNPKRFDPVPDPKHPTMAKPKPPDPVPNPKQPNLSETQNKPGILLGIWIKQLTRCISYCSLPQA